MTTGRKVHQYKLDFKNFWESICIYSSLTIHYVKNVHNHLKAENYKQPKCSYPITDSVWGISIQQLTVSLLKSDKNSYYLQDTKCLTQLLFHHDLCFTDEETEVQRGQII